MKRKIALLLSAVMAISAAPMTTFASSANALTQYNTAVPGETVFYERGIINQQVDSAAGIVHGRVGTTDYLNGTKNDALDAYVDGTELVIRVHQDIQPGATFDVVLENAEWFFRDADPTDTNNLITGASASVIGRSGPSTFDVGASIIRAHQVVEDVAALARDIVDNPNDSSAARFTRLYNAGSVSGGTPGSLTLEKPNWSLFPEGATTPKAVVLAASDIIGPAGGAPSGLARNLAQGSGRLSGRAASFLARFTGLVVPANPMGTLANVVTNATSTQRFGADSNNAVPVSSGATYNPAVVTPLPADAHITGNVLPARTYNRNFGLWITGGQNEFAHNNSIAGAYLRYGTVPVGFPRVENSQRTYLLTPDRTLGVDGRHRATVEVLDTVHNGETLVIPIVARTKGGELAKVTVATNGFSGVSSDPSGHVFAVLSGAASNTYVLDWDSEAKYQSGSEYIEVPHLVISELAGRIGSLRSGAVKITLPRGFVWNLENLYNNNNVTNSHENGVYVEPGISWASPAGVGSGHQSWGRANANSRDFRLGYTLDRNGNLNLNEIYLDVDIANSSNIPGKIFIKGLGIWAEDDAPMGDVMATISNFEINPSNTVANNDFSDWLWSLVTGTANWNDMNNNWNNNWVTRGNVVADGNRWGGNSRGNTALTGGGAAAPAVFTTSDMRVTEETFKVGERLERDIIFKAEEPKELVSGAYETQQEYNAEDEFHLAATVTFKENLDGAWASNRETIFTLPEGVKIRQVEFDETDNLGVNIEHTYAPGVGRINRQTGRPLDNNVGTHVRINEDSVALRNLGPDGGKSGFEMKLWLSVEAGFEGDIELAVGGSAVPTDLDPVVIATAISPVKLSVDRVTDLRIGYQEFEVADFKIEETKGGILRDGKEVRITITDFISEDMYFTADVKQPELVSGDARIKDFRVGAVGNAGSSAPFGAGASLGLSSKNQGTISFKIDRASSKDNPATWAFSDVKIKIDRVVPETSTDYRLVVWGTAIAENYGSNGDQFNTPGIMADYARVVSTASGSVLARPVSITMGEKFVTVGDRQVEMDVAAYVSPASDSTMVPIRFISNAFGISDDKITWDEANRTVTIDHLNRVVQFTIDSDRMVVNGVSRPMINLQNGPVLAEIKDDRAFVPFRAMGNAFGLEVEWDAETATATYRNPSSI